MTVERILPHLHRVRRSGRAQWSACCPAHDDGSPSLAIRETDDGRILMHCFGGCSVDDVLAVIGLEMSDLFPPRDTTPGAGHKPVRRQWSAADLLRMVHHEATIVLLSAIDLAEGRDITPEGRDRLLEATARLTDAVRVAAPERH
jgi:hypothetical protein